MIANKPANDVVDDVLQSRLEHRRKNKVECILRAAQEISAKQVRKSRFASGAMRA